MSYESPELRDYGTIVDLTAATGDPNTEDGGSKHGGVPLGSVAGG